MSQADEQEQVRLLESLPEGELLSSVAQELAHALPPAQLATDFAQFVESVAGILLRRSLPGLAGSAALRHIQRDVAAALLGHEASSRRLNHLWLALLAECERLAAAGGAR